VTRKDITSNVFLEEGCRICSFGPQKILNERTGNTT
jgi:hypothetical protein